MGKNRVGGAAGAAGPIGGRICKARTLRNNFPLFTILTVNVLYRMGECAGNYGPFFIRMGTVQLQIFPIKIWFLIRVI